MSLHNIGGSGPLKPNFAKPQQLPRQASQARPNSRSASGDQLSIGVEARAMIAQASGGTSPLAATPRDQIRNAKDLQELVGNLFGQEFGMQLPEKHRAKLMEFIGNELERLGLSFDQIKKSA